MTAKLGAKLSKVGEIRIGTAGTRLLRQLEYSSRNEESQCIVSFSIKSDSLLFHVCCPSHLQILNPKKVKNMSIPQLIIAPKRQELEAAALFLAGHLRSLAAHIEFAFAGQFAVLLSSDDKDQAPLATRLTVLVTDPLQDLLNRLEQHSTAVLVLAPTETGQLIVKLNNAGGPCGIVVRLVHVGRDFYPIWLEDGRSPNSALARTIGYTQINGVTVPVVLPIKLLYQRVMTFNDLSDEKRKEERVYEVQCILRSAALMASESNYRFADHETRVLRPRLFQILDYARENCIEITLDDLRFWDVLGITVGSCYSCTL